MRISWIDVKLGIRMLVKYPGLSLVSVTGMALAIAIGAGYFAAFGAMLDSRLPIDKGERAVVLRNRTVSGPNAGDIVAASPDDFVQWRGQLKSIEAIAAFRDDNRNLIAEDGRAREVRVAAITASAFRFTGVKPALGRALTDDDERPGAAPVVVIAHEEWQHEFGSDPKILERSVRLDETIHAIVGVMPQGFAFPVAHGYWVPLRFIGAELQPGAGQPLYVFGRLADGFSMSDARAELATVGDQMAAAFPQTHKDVRPHVTPYTLSFLGPEGPEEQLALRGLQFGVALLLIIVAVNVAILVYARTATRAGEIAVRTALGATRRRVVGQLFIEALVLSLVAATIGLTVDHFALGFMNEKMRNSPESTLPYWIQFGLSPATILYVGALSVLAGMIVGIVPALKATGKRVHAGLQQFSARGSGLQLGRTWTALIVMQVAIAVAALPAAMHFSSASYRQGTLKPPVVAHTLLKGTLGVANQAGEKAAIARLAERTPALLQRLEADAQVAAVTFAQRFPGSEMYVTFEAEGGGTSGDATGREPIRVETRMNRVALNFFDVFGVPVLAGRAFVAADANRNRPSVIVDQPFADEMGGGNVLGRRVRLSTQQRDGQAEVGEWLEIVGVVPAFAHEYANPGAFAMPRMPRLYFAAAPGDVYPAALVVKLRTPPAGHFAQRLRDITAAVEPNARFDNLEAVTDYWVRERFAFRVLSLGIVLVTLSVLLLSAAGIYAMMSFTVARRRREIGIRAALGADARRVLLGIFGRASAQLGAGIALGLAVASAIEWVGPGGTMGGNALLLLPSVVGLMSLVGLLAAVGPARRGLKVQPTEALRDE
jgi:putative ABC transport system permease protein